MFESIIALLLGGAILAAIARRIATHPALVAIAGAALIPRAGIVFVRLVRRASRPPRAGRHGRR